MAKARKYKRQSFRCTKEELDVIQQASNLLGLTPSEFIRNASINRARRIVSKESIRQDRETKALIAAFHKELADRGLLCPSS